MSASRGLGFKREGIFLMSIFVKRIISRPGLKVNKGHWSFCLLLSPFMVSVLTIPQFSANSPLLSSEVQRIPWCVAPSALGRRRRSLLKHALLVWVTLLPRAQNMVLGVGRNIKD